MGVWGPDEHPVGFLFYVGFGFLLIKQETIIDCTSLVWWEIVDGLIKDIDDARDLPNLHCLSELELVKEKELFR